MESFKTLFQEVEIFSFINWKPSDFKYFPKVLNIVTKYKTCGSKNGVVKIVVKHG